MPFSPWSTAVYGRRNACLLTAFHYFTSEDVKTECTPADPVTPALRRLRQMLDVMHACAATSASSCDEATAGDTGDSVTRWGVPVAPGSERIGNDEWGPGRGEQGIVQAYNYVIRTCGKAGGSEMALDLIQQMHKRYFTAERDLWYAECDALADGDDEGIFRCRYLLSEIGHTAVRRSRIPVARHMISLVLSSCWHAPILT